MEPAYLRISPVNINGIQTNRLMIVLKTKGCEYARKTGGCTVCGFINHAVEHIKEEQIIEQLDYALNVFDLKDVKEIDLLTLGSFYNENEVKETTRKMLLKKVSRLPDIKRVSFESRAEYVTIEKLKESKKILSPKIAEFAIGLESADDYIRNKIIKKGLTKQSFERVVAMVSEAGCDLLVYLLIKPPHVSERAAIEDAVQSVQYAAGIADKYNVNTRIAFEPVFICRDTPLETLFLEAQYRLVNLWSVVEIIKKTGHYASIFVGLSDENLAMDRTPNSCDKCYPYIVDKIEYFNKTQDINGLDKLDCRCKEIYENKLKGGQI